MGNLTLNGATSGQITLAPTAVAGTNTITLPAATGTVLTTAGGQTISGTVTLSTLTSPAATNLTIQSAGTTAMTIDTSQNVGIGTTSPGALLELSAANAAVYSAIRLTNTTGTGTTPGAAIEWARAGTVKSSIQANTFGNDYMAFCVNGNTERMRIDTSGNVGIGTSSPSSYYNAKLAVFGSSGTNRLSVANNGATGSDASDLLVCANGTTYFLQNIIYGNGVAYTQSNTTNSYIIGTSASAPLLFQTNGTERMRIDTSGNGFFGTTTSYGRFTVVPTTTQYSFASNAPNSSGTYYHFHCLAAGTTVGTIASTSTTTTYGTSSDYRLKHDVQTMTSGLATIAALKPVTYKWNIDDSIGEGFIAHELAEHIPLAVVGEKDAINEDGSINAQSVDYSKIVVHLVAAMQEQQSIISDLKSRIAALEAK